MRLIATNIKNLTDARFFAAYMPDLLVMPVQKNDQLEDTLQWWDQIKPWIEGPEWGLAMHEDVSDQVKDLLIKSGIQTILYEGDLTSMVNLRSFELIVKCNSMASLQQAERMPFIKSVVVDVEMVSDLQSALRTKLYILIRSLTDWKKIQSSGLEFAGIVVEGGDEEKVGVRSDDQLFDLLEAILG